MHYRCDIPKKLDFVCGMIGFGNEAFLFYFHTHAREPIDIHLHNLLVFTIMLSIFSIIGEMYNPHQVNIKKLKKFIIFYNKMNNFYEDFIYLWPNNVYNYPRNLVLSDWFRVNK